MQHLQLDTGKTCSSDCPCPLDDEGDDSEDSDVTLYETDDDDDDDDDDDSNDDDDDDDNVTYRYLGVNPNTSDFDPKKAVETGTLNELNTSIQRMNEESLNQLETAEKKRSKNPKTKRVKRVRRGVTDAIKARRCALKRRAQKTKTPAPSKKITKTPAPSKTKSKKTTKTSTKTSTKKTSTLSKTIHGVNLSQPIRNISPLLEGLSASQLQKVAACETENSNRVTLLRKIASLIKKENKK